MKNSRVHTVLIVTALAAVAAIVSLAARDSRGQSQKPKSDTLVKPTSLTRERDNSGKTTSAAPFANAAAENSVLQNEMAWTFGGKPRQGWYLYNLLIGRTLKTESEAASTDFAEAVAGWQKKSGLSSDGVLNETSFMAMVGQWQDDRIKDKTPATPDQLITVASSEFYDPERLEELRQVERKTYAAYKKMLAAAIADPTLKLKHTSKTELAASEKFFKIISSFRSREYQEKLRRESPNAGSAGLAMNSPHFTGKALDLYVGGDPVDTKDSNRAIQVNTLAYKWLVKNAYRFGFRPYFFEPWHWEYVK